MLPESKHQTFGKPYVGLAAPVGLGARDTLRLEAGMNLYGSDMDESTSPYESNMGSTVVLDDHEFIGKAALEQQLDNGVTRELTGLVMVEKGVLRALPSV